MKTLLFLLLIPIPVLASPLTITPIPWVQSNPDIPHIAVNGLPTHLQAVAEGGNCISYTYKWDINADGDFNDPNETPITVNKNAYFAPLHLETTLPNALGNTYIFPKVEVSCGSEIATATYPIEIIVDGICPNYYNDSQNPDCGYNGNLSYTRKVFSNRAVDIALWYLFRQATHRTNDSLLHDEHLCHVPGNQTLYSTGMTLNVFLRRGHGYGLNKDNDPYYRHMTQCGLHSILATMQLRNINFTDTDTLGTAGKGMEFVANNNLSAWFWSSYESTSWAEPLANFGNPEYISPVGRQGIYGNSLKHIGQDIIDGLLQCTTSDGAWFYTCSNLGGVTDDASTNGWAPEAIRLLKRKFNNVDYDAFKIKQRNWLSIYCPNGICFYDGNGNGKLAGNTLVGYGWTENEDLNTNAQVNASVNAIQSWYLTDNNHWGLYYIYASTKGLRSFSPEITYLPNGTNWSNEFTDFFLTGKNATKNSNNTAKQLSNGTWTWAGNWLWAGSFSTNEKTSVITQIIQSWLEVQPYAKVSPQLISPNTSVLFDHSWSYSLDPQVSISQFRWNVIDHIDHSLPDCSINQTNNCNEDLNKNFIVDENETIWDFTTSNSNETFSYIYTIPVNWGETKKQRITLRTIDNLNRIVDDNDSVEIKISKFNHAPIAISNTYTAYNKTSLSLDASNSYDTDIAQDPFPGDDIRPAGIKDSITEIAYDFNQDGVYETISNPTIYPINTTLDKLTIPFKICDDGQWTNLCKDTVENKDCSLCSYSSMVINVLPNTLPPNIILSSDVSIIDENALIDLSFSNDPENLNITFQVEITNGNGAITKITDSVYTYTPIGDGYRIDTIKVIATDEGGLSSEKTIYIEVPNIAPNIFNPNIEYLNLKPIIENTRTTNLGNGWYKFDIQAKPENNVLVQASVEISDYDLFLTTHFIYQGNVYTFETPPYITEFLNSNGSGIFSVDSSDGVDTTVIEIPFDNLPLASSLTYTIDVKNDGVLEVYNGSLNTYTFKADSDMTTISVVSADNLGLSTSLIENIDTTNDIPIISDVRVIKSDWQVLFIVIANDKDDLTYTLETGDGTVLTNQEGIFTHTYSTYGLYNPIVKVLDSRNGESLKTLDQISYIENLPPVINNITALVGYGGLTTFLIEATDNDPFTSYVYKDNTLLGQDNQLIKLPFSISPEEFRIKVMDIYGNSSEKPIMVSIADTPTELFISQYKLQNDMFLFFCDATDRDTEYLSYTWEIDGQVVNGNEDTLIYNLDTTIGHIIKVKVTDTWSGIETESLPLEIIGDTNPIISSVQEIIEAGGRASLEIESNATDFIVDWGDNTVNRNTFTHIYNTIGTYTVKVKGSKNGLESLEYIKDVLIIDLAPTLDNLYVNQVGNTAWIEVFVNEHDTEDLRYSFDLNADGSWEFENRRSNRTTYTFNQSGDFTIAIAILDTWSGIRTEFTEQFNIEEWDNGVDNIQVSEGDCVWFKAEGVNAVKVDPIKCKNFNDNMNGNSPYIWRVNGEDIYGSEIGYVFEDDGIYDVSLNNGGGISRIRVHVENVAPEFVSVPDSVIVAGSKYKYDIKIVDKGSTDIVELILGQGAPTTMELKGAGEENTWTLEWNVNDNLGGGEASIILIAEDTHRTEGYVTRDGGRTEQRFRIRILNKERDMSVVGRDMSIDEIGIKDVGMNEMGIVKDMKIGTKDMRINEMGTIEDFEIKDKDADLNRFRGNPSSGCNSNSNSSLLMVILLISFVIRRVFLNVYDRTLHIKKDN